MPRSLTVTDQTYLRDRGCDVEVTGTFTPGTRAYFDRSFGNWLPGDDACVEDITVKPIQDGEVPPLPTELDFEDLSKKDQDQITFTLAERAADDIRDRYALAAEHAAEEARDRRLEEWGEK